MASRFWVGGTGTWDSTSTANWSATSGGAAGASAPTNIDDVFFDSLSGTGTCTTDATATARDVTLNTSTLALTLGADLTITRTFIFTLGGLSLTGNAGNWVFTCLTVSSVNTNVRTIAFGTGNISLTGNAVSIWNMNATNFSHTGTPTINCTYAGATGTRTMAFTTGATEANSLNINVTAGTDIFSLPFVSRNINFTGFSGSIANAFNRSIFGSLTISSGMSVNAGTGTTSFLATSGTQQITTNGVTLDFPITKNGAGTLQLQDNLTMGSTRTFNLTAGTLDLNNLTLSTGLFVSNNSNVRTIAFGTGTIDLTGNSATVFSASTATNLTITGTPVVNLTYSGGTGSRQINGGSAAVLGEAQAISFNVAAGTDTVVLGSANAIKNIDFTGFSGTINASSATSVPIYGDFKLSATCTPSFAIGTTLNFAATSGTKTITCAGTTIGANISFTGLGGTWQFADALTLASTKTINFTNGTLKLKAGATSTVYGFTASGVNQKYLESTTPGSQATLSDPSGTVSVSYVTIKDINATGGATWYAPIDQFNIDGGNNDGWDFFVQLGEYMYTRRKTKRLLIS